LQLMPRRKGPASPGRWARTAHGTPDVIERQVRALGDDVVFGVTRLAEAARVRLHRQTRLIWRVHLRLTAALSDYDEERLRYLANRDS
jgi:hypothetical protein